jgi:tungstate transport system substrate-binding protein
MIRRVLAVFFGVSFASLSPCSAAEQLKLAVTTSFHNSGLSEVLLPAISQDLGLEVQLLVVGTGQALRLGRAGDVDAILVHARSAEEDFVAEGYAPYRREVMYNDFVFVGPKADPAQIAVSKDASEVMAKIAANQPSFVSRGDESGTHQKERALWRVAQYDPEMFGPWYRAVGAGMGAALNTAAGLDAYILADRASWLNFGNKAELALLFAGDPALFNQYAYLPVSAARFPHVNSEGAAALEGWLTGAHAKGLIDGYRIQGEALFTFNAAPK